MLETIHSIFHIDLYNYCDISVYCEEFKGSTIWLDRSLNIYTSEYDQLISLTYPLSERQDCYLFRLLLLAVKMKRKINNDYLKTVIETYRYWFNTFLLLNCEINFKEIDAILNCKVYTFYEESFYTPILKNFVEKNELVHLNVNGEHFFFTQR